MGSLDGKLLDSRPGQKRRTFPFCVRTCRHHAGWAEHRGAQGPFVGGRILGCGRLAGFNWLSRSRNGLTRVVAQIRGNLVYDQVIESYVLGANSLLLG